MKEIKIFERGNDRNACIVNVADMQPEEIRELLDLQERLYKRDEIEFID